MVYMKVLHTATIAATIAVSVQDKLPEFGPVGGVCRRCGSAHGPEIECVSGWKRCGWPRESRFGVNLTSHVPLGGLALALDDDL